jgi:hypothetical protein
MSRSITRFVIVLFLATALPALAAPVAETSGSVRDVRGFDRLDLGTSGDVVLSQGPVESLEIVASAADLDRISTTVSGGTLRIGTVRPGDSPRGRVTYRLTMKKIAALVMNSSGSFGAGRIDADGLRITINSSGSVSIGSLSARTLDVLINSSGSVTVAGSVDGQSLRSNSSGEYRAADLASREASIVLQSSGQATVRVSERLDGRISSSGSVRYHGNPSKVSVSATSSGRLVKLD